VLSEYLDGQILDQDDFVWELDEGVKVIARELREKLGELLWAINEGDPANIQFNEAIEALGGVVRLLEINPKTVKLREGTSVRDSVSFNDGNRVEAPKVPGGSKPYAIAMAEVARRAVETILQLAPEDGKAVLETLRGRVVPALVVPPPKPSREQVELGNAVRVLKDLCASLESAEREPAGYAFPCRESLSALKTAVEQLLMITRKTTPEQIKILRDSVDSAATVFLLSLHSSAKIPEFQRGAVLEQGLAAGTLEAAGQKEFAQSFRSYVLLEQAANKVEDMWQVYIGLRDMRKMDDEVLPKAALAMKKK
jgi:hypothetical protein